MTTMWIMPTITRLDIWIAIALTLLVVLMIKACRFTWPDPSVVQSYATVANTPGGLILILLVLWIGTLAITVAFCVWVLVRGIDPQNGTVVLITGMLSSGAFSAVSGALFTRMTGQEPKLPGTSSTSTTVQTPPAV
jgi:hypothetical protein